MLYTRTSQKCKHNVFKGAVLDKGAQRFVIGMNEALNCCIELAIGIHLAESQSIFVFGDDKQRSLGLLKIIIPTPIWGLKTVVRRRNETK